MEFIIFCRKIGIFVSGEVLKIVSWDVEAGNLCFLLICYYFLKADMN